VHYNSFGSRGWLDHSPIQNDIEIFAEDNTRSDGIRRAVKGVNIIFHLAH